MSLVPDVVFVGQGPNRACWERALLVGRRLRPAAPEEFARGCCDRLSLTGRAGAKLALLCDMEPREFYGCYARRNLLDRWLGKRGRGDAFDPEAAAQRAREINSSGFRRFVLLGRHVAEAFGFEHEPLRVLDFPAFPRSYLMFPHPSGANAFWNSAQGTRAARAVLRAFLELDEPAGVVAEAPTRESVAIRAVQETACRAFGVSIEQLLSPAATQPLSAYRMAAMAMARLVTGASYPAIAHAFRRAHHRSAIRATEAAASYAAGHADFADRYERFREMLAGAITVDG